MSVAIMKTKPGTLNWRYSVYIGAGYCKSIWIFGISNSDLIFPQTPLKGEK